MNIPETCGASRTAPVQVERGVAFPARIPWHFHERAWGAYAAAGHGDQSAERLAERGGFGVYELVACLALGDYNKPRHTITAEHIVKVRAEIEDWTSGVTALWAERAEEIRAAREAEAQAIYEMCEGAQHYDGKALLGAIRARMLALGMADPATVCAEARAKEKP